MDERWRNMDDWNFDSGDDQKPSKFSKRRSSRRRFIAINTGGKTIRPSGQLALVLFIACVVGAYVFLTSAHKNAEPIWMQPSPTSSPAPSPTLTLPPTTPTLSPVLQTPSKTPTPAPTRTPTRTPPRTHVPTPTATPDAPRNTSQAPKEQTFYLRVQDAIAAHQGKVSIEDMGLSEDAFRRISNLFFYEHPELFYANNGMFWTISSGPKEGVVTELEINYLLSAADCADWIRRLEAAVDEFLRFVPSDASGATKLKMLNDYLADTIVYNSQVRAELKAGNLDYEGDWWLNTAACLITGDGVCQGYSEAFKLIANRMGFPCEVVSGFATGVSTDTASIPAISESNTNHAWNIVRVNGQWYHVDATWNDMQDPGKIKPLAPNHYYEENGRKFFSEQEYIEYMSGSYFLKSDAYMREHDHPWWLFLNETSPVVALEDYER